MDDSLLDKIALVSAIGAFVGIGFFYVRRISQGRAATWWAWAWVAFFASLATSVAPGVAANLFAHTTGTLFPVLLLAGALAFTGRSVPAFLLPLGFAVGLGRGVAWVFDAHFVRDLGVHLFEAPIDLVAAWVVFSHGRRSGALPITAAMGALLVCFAALEVATPASLGEGHTPSFSYFSLGMATTLALALAQILALTEQVRVAHVRDLELLRTIAHAGTAQRDSVAVVRAAMEGLRARLALDAGGVWLLRERAGGFECVDYFAHVEVDMPDDLVHAPRDRPLPQQVLDTGNPIWIDDLAAEPALPVHPIYAEIGLRTGAVLPLSRGHEALGILVLGRNRVEPFGESERRILQTAASELSLALQHVEAVARLADERRVLASVLAASPTGILVADRAGEVELLNGTFALHMGLGSADAWPGRPVADVIASVSSRSGDPDELARAFDRAGGEAPITVSATLLAPEERELLVHGAPIEDEAGEGARGRVWVTRDVSEERRLQAQLRQSQKMETLGTLAGGVAHDFNNQLTAILGNARLVLDEEHDAEARAALADAVQAAEHCAELTRSLLAFARRAPISTEVVPTHGVVEQVAGLLRALLPATIHFRVVEEGALPPVDADPTQLQQILINLVVNARDALGGEGEIELSVRAREVVRPALEDAEPGAYVEFAVRDDGVGMDDETKLRIFDPFFTTKGVHEGTGLGLAVVYGAVRAHGGWVEVESAPGRGSTFRVLIPATSEVAAPAAERRAGDADAGVARILVADDEERLRRLVVRVLARAGHDVVEAADGREAVELFERAPDDVDLVVLDVTMPHVDGFEALKRIRAIRPDVPAILVSGLLGFDEPERGQSRTEYLPKPYDLAQLEAAVRRVLASPGADAPPPDARFRT